MKPRRAPLALHAAKALAHANDEITAQPRRRLVTERSKARRDRLRERVGLDVGPGVVPGYPLNARDHSLGLHRFRRAGWLGRQCFVSFPARRAALARRLQ